MKKLLYLLFTLTFAHSNGMNSSNQEYALNQAHKRVHQAKIKADNARLRQREVSWQDDRIKEYAQQKLIAANEAYYDACSELTDLQYRSNRQKAPSLPHTNNTFSPRQSRSANDLENDQLTHKSVDNILTLISQARISRDLGRTIFQRSLGKRLDQEGMSKQLITESFHKHLTPEETTLFMNGKADYPIVKKYLMAVDPENTVQYVHEFSK